jgi:hypothetical protein
VPHLSRGRVVALNLGGAITLPQVIAVMYGVWGFLAPTRRMVLERESVVLRRACLEHFAAALGELPAGMPMP